MTDEQLAEIQARADAATEGPWKVRVRDGILVSRHGNWLVRGTGVPNHEWRAADGEFIAHARTDVPALVAEVRRLREVCENQQIALDLHKQEFVERMDSEHAVEADNIRLRAENERLRKLVNRKRNQ